MSEQGGDRGSTWPSGCVEHRKAARTDCVGCGLLLGPGWWIKRTLSPDRRAILQFHDDFANKPTKANLDRLQAAFDALAPAPTSPGASA